MTLGLLFSFNYVFASDFPYEDISLVDPFTGEKYEAAKVSETFHYSRWRTKYLWRYITLYNRVTYEEPVKNVPVFEENCHDEGNRVASWEFSRGYERSISTGASLSVLGFIDIDFGGSLSRSFQVTITRWIQAERGIQALHIPLLKSESLEGITYQEIYYPNTGKFEVRKLSNPKFEVNYLNPIFRVQREVIGVCE